MHEPEPTREDVMRFSYAPSTVDAVYPEDYTGLPGGKIRSSPQDTKVARRATKKT